MEFSKIPSTAICFKCFLMFFDYYVFFADDKDTMAMSVLVCVCVVSFFPFTSPKSEVHSGLVRQR